MTRIEAIMRYERLPAVLHGLREVEHGGVTVRHARGHGLQRGVPIQEGSPKRADLVPKVSLTLVVRDELVAEIIETIQSAARTGAMGDGKIFVSPVTDAHRIRTGESGEDAL